MNLDLYLFNKINGQAKKSKALDFFAIACADYLPYGLLAVLIIMALATKSWPLFFLPLAGGLVSRFIVTQVIYFFYQRKRPSEVLAIQPLIKKPNHPSFPSGHAAFFFGLSFVLLSINYPLGTIFIVASCIVTLARIFCGVHWPADIVAGIGSAGITYIIISYL